MVAFVTPSCKSDARAAQPPEINKFRDLGRRAKKTCGDEVRSSTQI
jgi:hypothetical protein